MRCCLLLCRKGLLRHPVDHHPYETFLLTVVITSMIIIIVIIISNLCSWKRVVVVVVMTITALSSFCVLSVCESVRCVRPSLVCMCDVLLLLLLCFIQGG